MNTGGFASNMELLDWMAGQETLSDFDHPEENMPVSGAIALAGPQPDEGEGWEAHFMWNAEWRAKMKYMRASAMLAEKARREADHSEDKLWKVDHFPDAGKMDALESANRELVEALDALVGNVNAMENPKHRAEKARAILAKHKGAA